MERQANMNEWSTELELPAVARAFGTPAFAAALAAALEALPADALPLSAGLSRTGAVAPGPHAVRVIAVREEAGTVEVRVGIFYQGIDAGCSCADDPTPVEPQPEYCECRLRLDLSTGRARLWLSGD
jgi:hypothetical protein